MQGLLIGSCDFPMFCEEPYIIASSRSCGKDKQTNNQKQTGW